MYNETRICFNVGAFILPLLLLLLRILLVLPSTNTPLTRKGTNDIRCVLPEESKGSSIMILLGSGGHTGEMISILQKVDIKDFDRTWVISSGDSTSIIKSEEYEQKYVGTSDYKAQFLQLERARKVGEPIVSSIRSTLLSFLSTVKSLYKLNRKPDVLILNGPGTSVPLAYVLFFMKVFGVCNTKIIYIESLARVNNLSLSGKLLLPISDRFIVQWQQLFYKYKRAEYYGILI